MRREGSDGHPWRQQSDRAPAAGTGSGGPAQGSSTAVPKPFEAGNLAAMKSGAYSPRITDEYAQALVAWAGEQGTLHFLSDASFAPSVWRWATRTAMADLLLDRLTEHHAEGTCRGCKVCVSLEERWHKADRSAERAGERLGLDPQSRAELLVKLRQAGVIESEDEAGRSMLVQLFTTLKLAYDDARESGGDAIDAVIVIDTDGGDR